MKFQWNDMNRLLTSVDKIDVHQYSVQCLVCYVCSTDDFANLPFLDPISDRFFPDCNAFVCNINVNINE